MLPFVIQGEQDWTDCLNQTPCPQRMDGGLTTGHHPADSLRVAATSGLEHRIKLSRRQIVVRVRTDKMN